MVNLNHDLAKVILSEYLEFMLFSHFPSIDRLNYGLCYNNELKLKHTLEEIENCENEIRKLEHDELSVGYLRSEDDFKNYSNKNDFWVERFSVEITLHIDTITPIYSFSKEYFNIDVLNEDCYSREQYLWEDCPDSLLPDVKNLKAVILNEKELSDYIDVLSRNIDEIEDWNIVIEDILFYKKYNSSIKFLFQICDLLLYLRRRDMFLEFLEFDNLENEEKKSDLFQHVIQACTKLQGDRKYWGKIFENDRNKYIANLIASSGIDKYIVKDETQWSKSSKGTRSGELDIFILDKNELPLSIIEAINLDSLRRKELKEHLFKLFDYDVTGLKTNFMLIYSTALGFDELWNKYIQFIKEFDFKYNLDELVKEELYNYSDIKMIKSIHMRNGIQVECIHIMVNLAER